MKFELRDERGRLTMTYEERARWRQWVDPGLMPTWWFYLSQLLAVAAVLVTVAVLAAVDS